MKSLKQCKSGKEFISYASTHGANVRNGHGSHFVVSTKKGSVTVPVHGNSDLGTGLRCKIIKLLLAIGVTGLFVGWIIAAIT